MKDPDVTVHTYQDPSGFNETVFSTKVSMRHIEETWGREVFKMALEKIADHIAAEFIEKHGQEIAAKLDPVAIANLTIADAAAKTRELLDKKLPERVETVVREVERTAIYQRGVFGGLKKLR